MTGSSLTIKLPNLEATECLARTIVPLAEVGDVITLQGDLGAGKTAFARAFIQSWMQKDCEVPSPTFTLVQCYEKAGQTLYHFDLYRLKVVQEIIELGLEEALHTGVTLIEWPERLQGMELSNHLQIQLEFEEGSEVRKATILADRSWQDRMKLIKVYP